MTHVSPVSKGSKTESQPKTSGPRLGTMVPSVLPSNKIGSVPATHNTISVHLLKSWNKRSSYQDQQNKRKCTVPKRALYQIQQEVCLIRHDLVCLKNAWCKVLAIPARHQNTVQYLLLYRALRARLFIVSNSCFERRNGRTRSAAARHLAIATSCVVPWISGTRNTMGRYSDPSNATLDGEVW